MSTTSRILLSMLVASVAALGGAFTGTSSGIFLNPVGDPGMVVTGVGTNHFTWGVGSPGPSELLFTGVTFSTPSETEFVVGSLWYHNGTIATNTFANAVDLSFVLTFTTPTGLAASLPVGLTLVNTPNSGTAQQNADIVYLPSLSAKSIFTVDGISYTLKLRFGDTSAGGFSEISKFFIYEGESATAQLRGTLTTDVSGVVPEPGTWAFMTGGLALLIGLRSRLRGR